MGRQVVAALAAKTSSRSDCGCSLLSAARAKRSDYGEEPLPVEPVGPDAFRGVNTAVLAAPADVSRTLGARLEQGGAWVVDCSGAFRVDAKVPLVALGINDGMLDRPFSGRIVSVAQPGDAGDAGRARAVAREVRARLGRRHRAGGRGPLWLGGRRAPVSAGRAADEREGPRRRRLSPSARLQRDSRGGRTRGGLSKLERTLLVEAARILNGASVPALTCTSVLVPIYHGMLLFLSVHLKRPADAEAVRAALAQSSSLKVLDEPDANVYPMPMLITDDASVHVGRVRVLGERVQLVAAVDGALRAADAAAELVLELVER